MKLKLTLAGSALLACSASVWAGAPQTFGDELILDWDDLRAMLRERGIDLRIGYVSETATNAQGGNEELWRYTDQWTFQTRLDLQKLFELNQAQFGMVITDRNGHSLSADAHLGSLQSVQQLYGRGQTWRWTEFWYDQKYANGLLDWKIGRLPEGDDFASFSCEFMNLTFCGAPPGNIVGTYWYNWPVSQWATRVKANVTGFGYVQLGAYEVNPSYLLTRYALGGWYSSSTVPDVVENADGQPVAIAGGQPLMRHGQYGAYLNFQQRLTAGVGTDSKRGLSVFANATYADRRTSTIDSQVAVGMLYQQPFAWRSADELGIAVGETHVNPRVADVERLQNARGYGLPGAQTSEWVAEAFYNIHVKGWLDLRPSVEDVVAPGGVSRNANDLIVGLRLAINL
jgi:porin